MKKELLDFVLKYELSPFSKSKSSIKSDTESIYKTTDAKKIHTKTLDKISMDFVFKETSNIWNLFDFTTSFSEIKKRQDFFSTIKLSDNSFLKNLKPLRQSWNPEYDVIVVTEDEETFIELKNLNCPIQLIINENDIMGLEKYDLVQIVDCENYRRVLENLPQAVFIDDFSSVYLERYLEELSCWKENINYLRKENLSSEVKVIFEKLVPLVDLINVKVNQTLSIESVEEILEDINEEITNQIKKMTLEGEDLVKVLSGREMPSELKQVIEIALSKTQLPEYLFKEKIPLEIDYTELENEIKKRNANKFTNLAEEIKKHAEELKQVPELLKQLSGLLIVEDFCLGVSSLLTPDKKYPLSSENLILNNVENLFVDKAQPISFQLDNSAKCSILTGANSGGKTTLLENVLQKITLSQLGLPIYGDVQVPFFTDVYYFAKNKGATNKGAFENLLTQMSKIKPGNSTLILADEIEAVTEPGVAGKVIAATADYFIKQNCFLIIATHLGYEIQDSLPEYSRIDGIEAKGVDENFNLIVDHNPVMGRLAHSTPELIVEKMANTLEDDYFKYLNDFLNKGKCISY